MNKKSENIEDKELTKMTEEYSKNMMEFINELLEDVEE